MLRSSRFYRTLGNNGRVDVFKLRAQMLTPNRAFNYQKEIYLNSYDSHLNDKSLKDQLTHVYRHRANEANLYRYINAYHKYGVRQAKLDPLNQQINRTNAIDELNPTSYGLVDDNGKHNVDGLLFNAQSSSLTLKEISAYLNNYYANNISIEFDFLQNEDEKLWLNKEYERIVGQTLDNGTRLEILKLLLKSQVFDHFLGSKFPTFKRYSNEGSESSMVFYYSLFSNLAKADLEELIMGIAHRGRLNLKVCLLDLDPALLFSKIKGKHEFGAEAVSATGDVAHHLPCSTDVKFSHGKQIHVSLLFNPSHLEAVDPVVLGKTRSKQMKRQDCFYSSEQPINRSNKVASFLVHGDAAFAAQGIVPETFQLGRVPNYGVGGTVHLITNNQLGFTNPSNLGRSSNLNSDLAKAFECPVIHVNGDYPELAWKAAELAANYRNKFGKDILVDLVCFRKYGHNELDDPSFTNPLMYKIINARNSVPNNYEKELYQSDVFKKDKSTVEFEINQFKANLDSSYQKVMNSTYKIEPRNTYLKKQWSNMSIASNTERTYWSTGFDRNMLKQIGYKSVQYPEGFAVHPTIERAHVKKRIERLNEGTNIDWSTAEALAVGSLLLQGFNVRISGQDVGRGTFSHRHAIFVEQNTGRVHIPLNNLEKEQKNFFEVCNSILSEEAVLGFDYGFSADDPKNLVLWEAQFGDFFNGAQILIDTYVCSAETKWMHQSALVMLLPHGFDGAGPEHSSSRIERFLQSSSSKEDKIDADDINYYVAHPTTPANYFHLLRRQMIQPFRKPLIVASPKILIRLPECVSSLAEMDVNTQFRPVIDDPNKTRSRESVKRLIFVFGKHYYALEAERAKRNLNDVAIIRIEEVSPFPAHELRNVIKEYKNAKEFVWSQEEHRNMGAWSFVLSRFERILGVRLNYAGRENHCAVVGIGSLHAAETKQVLDKTFEKI